MSRMQVESEHASDAVNPYGTTGFLFSTFQALLTTSNASGLFNDIQRFRAFVTKGQRFGPVNDIQRFEPV